MAAEDERRAALMALPAGRAAFEAFDLAVQRADAAAAAAQQAADEARTRADEEAARKRAEEEEPGVCRVPVRTTRRRFGERRGGGPKTIAIGSFGKSA